MAEIGNSWGSQTWAPDTWAEGTWQNQESFVPGRGVKAVDILDKPTCAGGLIRPNGRIVDCRQRVATFTLNGEDEFLVEVPASSAAANYLTSRNVVRVHYADLPDNFHEWRFLDDEVTIKRRGGIIQAKAYDLINDLAAPGPIRLTDATTGIPIFDFSVEATATELIDTYILPRLAAKGYTWIARGTVEFTEKRLWEWQRLNPLELLRYICSVRGHEYRLRRNGVTNYLIDVLETINGSAPVVEVRPGLNLKSLTRKRKGANHYTVLEGFGATAQDGQRATIARAAWRVTAVDPVNHRLTLADPSGVGVGPILEDDQFVYTGHAPGYLFRYNRGGLHRIVDAFAATQQVQLDSVVGYAVDDLVEIRASAGATSIASEIPDGWTTPHNNGWFGKRVTNVDGANTRITVDNPFTAANDPIILDDRYRGWIVRPYFRTASTAYSGTSSTPDGGLTRQLTVTSTTGMQAGDLAYFTAFAVTGAPSWSLANGAAFEVVSVDSATLVTIRFRRKVGTIGAFGAAFFSTWRARTPDRVCKTCSASANTLDLDSVTSIATDDLVEVLRRYDGAVRTELASPSGIAASGIRLGTFERPNRGEVNLLAPYNPLFATWPGGANALPASWYSSGTLRAFGLKNTTAAYLRTGDNSVRVKLIGRAQMSAGISAGATSVTVTGLLGGRFEVGESVVLGHGTGNAETVVLTSVSSDGLTIGFAACANAHSLGDEVRSVAASGSTAASGAASLLSEQLDCPALPNLASFGVLVPVFPRGLVTTDEVKVTLSVVAHAELGGTNQSQTVTVTPNTGLVVESWNEIFVPITGAAPGGLMRVEIVLNPAAGNTYPSDKLVYVGAVGLFQASYNPGVIPRYSFATELHQAANTKLGTAASGAPASFDMGVADLYGLDPRNWPGFQFIIGGTARTTEQAAGVVGLPLRILKLTLDYDRPADARAQVGTRQQRLTEILANASVPVPVVKVNTDGSTETLTAASQQRLSFPTIGANAPPTELFVVRDA